MSAAREMCGRCKERRAITVAVEGVRLCAPCRNEWLIEETDSFAIASRLNPDELDCLKVFTASPSRIGFRSRVLVIDSCEFPLFAKVWGGDCHRYFLTSLGVEVKDAARRLEAAAESEAANA